MIDFINNILGAVVYSWIAALAVANLRGHYRTGRSVGPVELVGILWRGEIGKARKP